MDKALTKGRTIRKVMGGGETKQNCMQGKMSEKKSMQGKMSEKKFHAQDGPHFDMKPQFVLPKCSFMSPASCQDAIKILFS